MKVICQMAVSLDGFIASKSSGTSWIHDYDEWEWMSKEAGHMVVGRTTYEEVKEELFSDVHYFVLGEGADTDLATFGSSPQALLDKVEEHEFGYALLCGGGLANQAFLNAGLINELILDIHPVLLTEGTKLFSDWQGELKLELLNTKKLNSGIVQNHYLVVGQRDG